MSRSIRLTGMSKLALLAVLTLMAVGCLGSDFEDSIEGSWQLASGRVDGEEITIADTNPITIDFESEQVSGNGSCNHYSGSYALSGSSISFEPMAFTEMACFPEELMETEMMYGEALTRVEEVILDDGLVLRGSGVELVFEAVEPVPDAELTNTVWVLDSQVTGDAVSSVLGERATLEFFTDGSLIGGTGCREFTGSYELSGAEVTILELVYPAHGCEPDLAPQDDHVLSVLDAGFSTEIDGEALNITGPGDLGLVYIGEG